MGLHRRKTPHADYIQSRYELHAELIQAIEARDPKALDLVAVIETVSGGYTTHVDSRWASAVAIIREPTVGTWRPADPGVPASSRASDEPTRTAVTWSGSLA
jgi:hypothetical protein